MPLKEYNPTCPCNVCGDVTFLFDIKNPCTNGYVLGALVTVKEHTSGTIVGTCTVNSAGPCQVTVPGNSYYDIEVTFSGCTPVIQSNVRVYCAGKSYKKIYLNCNFTPGGIIYFDAFGCNGMQPSGALPDSICKAIRLSSSETFIATTDTTGRAVIDVPYDDFYLLSIENEPRFSPASQDNVWIGNPCSRPTLRFGGKLSPKSNYMCLPGCNLPIEKHTLYITDSVYNITVPVQWNDTAGGWQSDWTSVPFPGICGCPARSVDFKYLLIGARYLFIKFAYLMSSSYWPNWECPTTHLDSNAVISSWLTVPYDYEILNCPPGYVAQISYHVLACSGFTLEIWPFTTTEDGTLTFIISE